MSKYTVIGTNLKVGGKLYREGEIVELDEATASELGGHVTVAAGTSKQSGKNKTSAAESPAGDDNTSSETTATEETKQ
jgi:hypothetical protein